jgi:hypothetical protein
MMTVSPIIAGVKLNYALLKLKVTLRYWSVYLALYPLNVKLYERAIDM